MHRFALASLVAGALVMAPGIRTLTAHAGHGSSALSASAVLRQDMRKLWTDHVVWTREYIVAAVAGGPDQAAAAGRLMRNQEEIGQAVAAYYGADAGAKLTSLLKEHISIAVDLIKAAKAGDAAASKRIDAAWHANSGAIADLLAGANPNWPRADLVEMMNAHLSTTTDEVVARITKDWDRDVRAFDAVYAHILSMADALTDGIIAQFPSRFGHAD